MSDDDASGRIVTVADIASAIAAEHIRRHLEAGGTITFPGLDAACPACGQAAPPDALRVVDGPRAGLACPGCAETLRRAGWAVVRRGRA